MTAQTLVTRGRQTLRRWVLDKNVQTVGLVAAHGLGGFLISAGSLLNAPLPLAMGLICAMTGWRAAVTALGSVVGYWVFWGAAGYQGMVWTALGCMTALFLGKRRVIEEAPLLIPAMAAFFVSSTGLLFQIVLKDEGPLSVYLLRIGMGAACAWLFYAISRQRDAVTDWLAQGVAVLALAQVAPLPWMSLGFLAAGALCVGEAFPAAALAGIALDLSGITAVPMTAVLCLGFLIRMLPLEKKWLGAVTPAVSCLMVMGFCGIWDFAPLPGLVLGGALGALLPGRAQSVRRRGETGIAQVRLELMAGVLSQTQQLLLETPEIPIDEEALLCRVKERACGGCPNRKNCRDIEIPPDSLRREYADAGSLGFFCRKPGRMLLELRRGQEQLRGMKADRERRRQYREAVVQQYQFLAEFLRQQADQLPKRAVDPRQRYQPEVAVCSAGKSKANGDRCVWFTGTQCRYYILLCDGMGTGIGAAQESQTAAEMLKNMLSAGFPAEYALRSLNSLTALRGRAGAVTVDLAEISLDNGWVTIYKWGAAPSWVLRVTGAEKIGTAGPPPGMSVLDTRETVERLSLRRGETLILVSDGVDGEGVLRRLKADPAEPPGELAAYLLEQGAADGTDDATAAVVRLSPAALST